MDIRYGGNDSRSLRAVARAARVDQVVEPIPMPMPSPLPKPAVNPALTATDAVQRATKRRKTKVFSSEAKSDDVDTNQPDPAVNTGVNHACIDIEGTVHELPRASRLAINKKLYAASQLTNPRGYKPYGRCSFPCGMRRKKCKETDEQNCQFVMIKATTYWQGLSPEKIHAAAVIRIKADYDEVVDSVALYEDCEKESAFVDDRHLVLTHVFCCACELNRLCSGHYHAPIEQPGFLSHTACRNCCSSHSLVRRSRPKILTADTNPAHQRHLVEARNHSKPERHGAHS